MCAFVYRGEELGERRNCIDWRGEGISSHLLVTLLAASFYIHLIELPSLISFPDPPRIPRKGSLFGGLRPHCLRALLWQNTRISSEVDEAPRQS